MAICTAPSQGHRTPSGAAACPACGSRYGRSYGSYQGYTPSYSDSYSSNYSSGGTPRGSSGKTKPRWSSRSSGAYYTSTEIKTLTPIHENAVRRATIPDLRDVFLCHAWDDRNTTAQQLHDLLEAKGVSVWFSQKDIPLGSLLMREIDKGLRNSKIGIVLVTPAFLKRVAAEGIAEKELSALMAQDLLVPVIHDTSYEELRDVSPLLGSRSGLSTSEDTLDMIALKLSELVGNLEFIN